MHSSTEHKTFIKLSSPSHLIHFKTSYIQSMLPMFTIDTFCLSAVPKVLQNYINDTDYVKTINLNRYSLSSI